MTFQTATSTLVWRNGDWKLAASRSRPGPTPRVTGPKVSGRAFVDGAGRLQELRYAPSGARWLAFAALLACGALLAAPSSVVAQAKDDDCQALDTGPIPNPAQAACDVGEAVIDKGPAGAAADAIAAPVKAAGDEVMKGVTTWVANGAGWLVGQAGKLIDETTTPRIKSDWFNRQYDAMIALAAVFALPLLLLAVMQGVLRRDGGLVLRAAAWHLPLAFLLTGIAVAVVSLLLDITDQASAQVAASVGNDAKEFFGDVGKSLTAVTAATGQAAVPLFAVFLGGLVAAMRRSSCGSSCCCARPPSTSACCSFR
jgi:uncharacterized RDD family membrane protein YckC